jgi:hypothetical protein
MSILPVKNHAPVSILMSWSARSSVFTSCKFSSNGRKSKSGQTAAGEVAIAPLMLGKQLISTDAARLWREIDMEYAGNRVNNYCRIRHPGI